MKHTPGPWSYIEDPTHHYITIDAPSQPLGKREVAYLKAGYPETARANARLIAAAPELLQVAIDALEELKHANKTGCFTNGSNRASKVLIDALDAALSAAEGGK